MVVVEEEAVAAGHQEELPDADVEEDSLDYGAVAAEPLEKHALAARHVEVFPGPEDPAQQPAQTLQDSGAYSWE